MKKQPEKKSKLPWMICLAAVVLIMLARVICHFADMELSGAVSRGFGWAETVAVAGMVYFYLRWRRSVREK